MASLRSGASLSRSLSGGRMHSRPCDDSEVWRAALDGIEDFAAALVAPISMPGFVPFETASALILRAIADSQDVARNPLGDVVLRAPIRAWSHLTAAASTSASGAVQHGRVDESESQRLESQ